ncbi:MAG TPA: metallophosphoesterase [Polyangiaceae bacterium]|nr:metallophosphoesterase [Polyangiaceae bacterium]
MGSGGRRIFIGDVHGCAAELSDLLSLLGPGSSDAVYFVGDLVARGPDSRGVLKLYREIAAKGVIGNHEARLIEVRRARARGEEGPKLGPSHEALLKELGDSDWTLLESLPLYLELKTEELRVVHAGVLPGVPLRKQEAWALTHIRSVDANGKASSEPGVESWAAGYRESPHVVFGHDARRGLQLHPAATGLDTACVYGGSLTALVLPKGTKMPFPKDRRDLLVSVRARAQYYTTPGFT